MKTRMAERVPIRSIISVASVAVVAVAISCSGEPESGTAGQTTVRVGVPTNSIAFFPTYVARTNGYFRDAGLDVPEPLQLKNGANVNAALSSGSIEVGQSVMTDVLSLANRQRPVTAVGELVRGYYVDIIASTRFLEGANLAPQSSLMEKVQALRGRKIGITGPGSGTEALVKYVFAQAGLDATKDATLVSLGGTSSTAVAALRTGRVDAVSYAINVTAAAQARGVGRALISPTNGDIPALNEIAHAAMYVQPDFIKENQAAVRSFVSATGRALEFIRTNPAEAKRLLADYFEGMDPGTLEEMYRVYRGVLPEDMSISRPAYESAIVFHRETGLLSGGQDIPFEMVIDNSFVRGTG